MKRGVLKRPFSFFENTRVTPLEIIIMRASYIPYLKHLQAIQRCQCRKCRLGDEGEKRYKNIKGERRT